MNSGSWVGVGRSNAVGPRRLTIFALLAPVPLPGAGGVGVSIPAVGHFGGIEAESAPGRGEPVLAAASSLDPTSKPLTGSFGYLQADGSSAGAIFSLL
jgi:hypothetical protein